MATKETTPGLLSKVAKFVRNPTKDWSELDNLDASPESGYDKQALKEMIERKRQNDFIRRREFDQLRKLRNRDGVGVGGLSRSSVFQSSMTTDQDGRAVTLKKIDEIEAQMSKQWWKGKQDPAGAHAAASSSVSPALQESVRLGTGVAGQSMESSRNFTSTRLSETGYNASEQADTEMGAGMSLPPASGLSAGRRAGDPASVMGSMGGRNGAGDVAFSTSKLFALEVDEMATDPELEEAAIRFANGDDAGAEFGLLQALRGASVLPEVSLSWAAALLDLYRATQSHDKFDQAAQEFSTCFGPARPVWSRIPGPLDAGDHHAASQAQDTLPRGLNAQGASDAIWVCPPELTVAAMEDLREAMSSRPMPWHLDWAHLQGISPDAMHLVSGLFGSLCDEPVDLRFSGADSLVQTLRRMMPAGDRSVDSSWWAVRLNALRVMQLLDEFELAALDFCVTFEVSPPAWVSARCNFQVHKSTQSPAFANTEPAAFNAGHASSAGFSQAATVPMPLDETQSNALALNGEVLGDATALLSGMRGSVHSGERIIVSCVHLVRVDFSAAGSILNWVAARQSEGCQVQFRDVQRLVAAFFNVIGITEHARVIPKAL